MKIAISGVTGFRNRGVEALLRPIVEQLGRVFRDAEVTIYSESPDYDRRRQWPGRLKFAPVGKARPQFSRRGRWIRRLGLNPGPGRYRGWSDLQGADLLIVTGGDVFSSEYGDASFEKHLVPMRIARQHGVPYVILAQSIGPFTSDLHRSGFMDVARDAAAISVREDRTLGYLVDELGLDPQRVHRVADPAFLLEPSSVVPGATEAAGDMGAPVVAISISEGIAGWNGMERDQQIKAWASLIGRMQENWGARVLLIPHVQERYCNDLHACTDVWRELAFRDGVRVMGADLSADEFKGVIRNCDFVVAERMHAGIAGLSSEVCTSIIAYSVKARGVIDEMLGPYASKGALVEGTDFKDVEKVWKQLDSLWAQRAQARAHLAESVPQARAQAIRAFDMIPEVLGEKAGSGFPAAG